MWLVLLMLVWLGVLAGLVTNLVTGTTNGTLLALGAGLPLLLVGAVLSWVRHLVVWRRNRTQRFV